MDDDLGAFQNAEGSYGKKFGITRTRPHQKYLPHGLLSLFARHSGTHPEFARTNPSDLLI